MLERRDFPPSLDLLILAVGASSQREEYAYQAGCAFDLCRAPSLSSVCSIRPFIRAQKKTPRTPSQPSPCPSVDPETHDLANRSFLHANQRLSRKPSTQAHAVLLDTQARLDPPFLSGHTARGTTYAVFPTSAIHSAQYALSAGADRVIPSSKFRRSSRQPSSAPFRTKRG